MVRREGYTIRRYVHLATGNYNPTTARIYTDLGLFTCRPEFGEDVTNFFNLLTGICQFQGLRKLVAAPFELHGRLLQLIERETENARHGLPARIILKLNSLVDRGVIEALYRASEAGVRIRVDRARHLLPAAGPQGPEREHHRPQHCGPVPGAQPGLLLRECLPARRSSSSSADWMPRNFFRRIELAFPIEDGNLRERIISEVLAISLADNVKARFLQPDGSYRRSAPADGKACRSQVEFMALATGAEDAPRKRVAAKTRYPNVKLAPSPFTSRKPAT